MSLTCPQCGADNRDSAKFCLKCAHQLVALDAPQDFADTELSPSKRRRRRSRRARSAPSDTGRTARAALWGLLGMCALVALGAALWLWTVGSNPRPEAAAASATTPESALPPLSPAPESAALAQAADALKTLAAEAEARAAQEAATRAAEASQPRAAPSPRPVANKKADDEVAPAEPAPPPPAPAPEPAPQPVAPPPPPTPPRELCAGTTFLARAACLQSECSQPGLFNHPQCIRMRELQEALRHPDSGG